MKAAGSTIRTEMHRIAAGHRTAPVRETGSSVWQVFEGTGTMSLDGAETDLVRGDIIAVPSWCEMTLAAHADLDLFRFSDAPILERLNLYRATTRGYGR